ncbi:unnamed protein product [Mortierella alpina]
MERISSTGSIKRPSSIHSGSGYIPTSPVASVAPVAVGLHDDAFSTILRIMTFVSPLDMAPRRLCTTPTTNP